MPRESLDALADLIELAEPESDYRGFYFDEGATQVVSAGYPTADELADALEVMDELGCPFLFLTDCSGMPA